MCLFCKIVKGEIPSNKVDENDDFLCFYDINPVSKIHVLIIPKKHYDSFDVIPPKLMEGMTQFIHQVATKLNIRDKGYRLITNIKEHGGQEVFHFHIHLLAGEYIGRLRA